jgi:hypothetical protein
MQHLGTITPTADWQRFQGAPPGLNLLRFSFQAPNQNFQAIQSKFWFRRVWSLAPKEVEPSRRIYPKPEILILELSVTQVLASREEAWYEVKRVPSRYAEPAISLTLEVF